jgi:hypothetical protein
MNGRRTFSCHASGSSLSEMQTIRNSADSRSTFVP